MDPPPPYAPPAAPPTDPNLAAALMVLTQAMTTQTARDQRTQDLLAVQQAEIARLVDQVARNGVQPASSVLQNIPVYQGMATESFDDWAAIINRAAISEHWDEARKRRIAIAKLGGGGRAELSRSDGSRDF